MVGFFPAHGGEDEELTPQKKCDTMNKIKTVKKLSFYPHKMTCLSQRVAEGRYFFDTLK